MKTALIHCFSGTGNALHLAERLSRGFARRDYACSIELLEERLKARDGFLIDPANVRDLDSVDLFVFPVYAFSLPHIVRRYMKKVRCTREGAKAAVLCVVGTTGGKRRDGYEGRALEEGRRLLSARGWDVVLTDVFDYPHSISSLMSAPRREIRDAIVASLDSRIEATVSSIVAFQRSYRPLSVFNRIWTRVAGWGFSLVGRRVWGKLYAADGRCDGCALCARRCPAGVIRMTGGRPSWNFGCEGCERCVNLCPKQAIQFSLLKMLAFSALFVLPLPGLSELLRAVSGEIPAIAREVSRAAAELLADCTGLLVVDRLVFFSGFVPGLRSVVGFGYTRFLRKYSGPVDSRT